MNDEENKFPRKLKLQEKELLFSVLPENKTGYKLYRDKIENLFVTGKGRFERNNFILGIESSIPDLTLPLPPVFALGRNFYKEAVIDITIHEESEGTIEFDFSAQGDDIIPDELTEIKRWNYSEWIPGMNDPESGSFVREVPVSPGKYLLAAAPGSKKLWLHESGSGINHLIPVSNFYNELMRLKNIRDFKSIIKPYLLFQNLSTFSDDELIRAFLSYSKYMKKFHIGFGSGPGTGNNSEKKKNFISKFLGKGKI